MENYGIRNGIKRDKVILDLSSPDPSSIEVLTRRPYGMVTKVYTARNGYRISKVVDGEYILWKTSNGHSCEHVVIVPDDQDLPQLIFIHFKNKKPLCYERNGECSMMNGDCSMKNGEWRNVEETTFYKSFDHRVYKATLVASLSLDFYKGVNSKRYRINKSPKFPFTAYAPNVSFRLKSVSAGVTLWTAQSEDENCVYTSCYPKTDPIVVYLVIESKGGFKELFYAQRGFFGGWHEVTREDYVEELKKLGFDASTFDNRVVLDVANIDADLYYGRKFQLGNFGVRTHTPFLGFKVTSVMDGDEEIWRAQGDERCTYMNEDYYDDIAFALFILVECPGNAHSLLYFVKSDDDGWREVEKCEYYDHLGGKFGVVHKRNVDRPNIIMSSFKNRQGIRLTTYASTLENSRGNIIMIHGLRSHFKSEFLAYNNEWNFENLGSMFPLDINGIWVRKWKHKYDLAAKYRYLFEHSDMNGKNLLKFSPRYEYEYTLVAFLNRLGFNVYGMDLQSNGLSDSIGGIRCHANDYRDYVHDLLQFISIVKRGAFSNANEEWNESLIFQTVLTDKRTFIWGHSMGGNVAVQATQEFYRNVKDGAKFIDGIVITSGMFSLDNHINTWWKRAGRPFLGILAQIIPEDVNSRKSLINCGDVFDSFIRHKDPFLRTREITYKAAALMFSACDEVLAKMSLYPRNMPMLLIQTKNDTVCSIKGSREVVESLKDAKDVQLIELDGDTHYLPVPHSIFVYQKYVEDWLETHI